MFLLSREHVFFDYDASLLGSNPDTIITVSPEGNLAIPVLDAADQRRVLGETAELVSLADAAARPPQRIERDMLGCG